jgi:hypothetical protein
MEKLVSIFLISMSVFITDISSAEPTSAQLDSTSWCFVLDAGVFPAANRVGVGWYPVYSVRAGIGKDNGLISPYLFFDFYSFSLSEPGGLHSYIQQNARRHDLAVYPALWISHVLFLGAGVFKTSSDPVTITSIYGVDPWTGGDMKGWSWFSTIGLTWDIQLTSHITVPVGLYYRNPGYSANNMLLAVRAGINMRIK